MKDIAISIGGFHETTEDTDYGTLWADTAEAVIYYLRGEGNQLLHKVSKGENT